MRNSSLPSSVISLSLRLGVESDVMRDQSPELPLSTHIGLWRFSGRLADVLCKRPFTEIVEKIRIR